MIKNPLKLRQIEKRMSEKRMMMMMVQVTQVKEMVHRKKRVKHLRKKRKKMRMALSLKPRQKKKQKPL